MIPKIIHRCWFGSAPMSPLIRKCEESLHRFAAGYELRLWTDANCPDLPFVAECRRWRKWARKWSQQSRRIALRCWSELRWLRCKSAIRKIWKCWPGVGKRNC